MRKIIGVGGGLAGTEKGLGQTWNKLKTAASTLKEKVKRLCGQIFFQS